MGKQRLKILLMAMSFFVAAAQESGEVTDGSAGGLLVDDIGLGSQIPPGGDSQTITQSDGIFFDGTTSAKGGGLLKYSEMICANDTGFPSPAPPSAPMSFANCLANCEVDSDCNYFGFGRDDSASGCTGADNCKCKIYNQGGCMKQLADGNYDIFEGKLWHEFRNYRPDWSSVSCNTIEQGLLDQIHDPEGCLDYCKGVAGANTMALDNVDCECKHCETEMCSTNMTFTIQGSPWKYSAAQCGGFDFGSTHMNKRPICPGGELPTSNAANFVDCQSQCLGEPTCNLVTYHLGTTACELFACANPCDADIRTDAPGWDTAGICRKCGSQASNTYEAQYSPRFSTDADVFQNNELCFHFTVPSEYFVDEITLPGGLSSERFKFNAANNWDWTFNNHCSATYTKCAQWSVLQQDGGISAVNQTDEFNAYEIDFLFKINAPTYEQDGPIRLVTLKHFAPVVKIGLIFPRFVEAENATFSIHNPIHRVWATSRLEHISITSAPSLEMTGRAEFFTLVTGPNKLNPIADPVQNIVPSTLSATLTEMNYDSCDENSTSCQQKWKVDMTVNACSFGHSFDVLYTSECLSDLCPSPENVTVDLQFDSETFCTMVDLDVATDLSASATFNDCGDWTAVSTGAYVQSEVCVEATATSSQVTVGSTTLRKLTVFHAGQETVAYDIVNGGNQPSAGMQVDISMTQVDPTTRFSFRVATLQAGNGFHPMGADAVEAMILLELEVTFQGNTKLLEVQVEYHDVVRSLLQASDSGNALAEAILAIRNLPCEDHSGWNTPWGRCASYAVDGSNHGYCFNDIEEASGLRADQACRVACQMCQPDEQGKDKDNDNGKDSSSDQQQTGGCFDQPEWQDSALMGCSFYGEHPQLCDVAGMFSNDAGIDAYAACTCACTGV